MCAKICWTVLSLRCVSNTLACGSVQPADVHGMTKTVLFVQTPSMLSWKTMNDCNNMYNTQCSFAIWAMKIITDGLIQQGGLKVVEKQVLRRAADVRSYCSSVQQHAFNRIELVHSLAAVGTRHSSTRGVLTKGSPLKNSADCTHDIVWCSLATLGSFCSCWSLCDGL